MEKIVYFICKSGKNWDEVVHSAIKIAAEEEAFLQSH